MKCASQKPISFAGEWASVVINDWFPIRIKKIAENETKREILAFVENVPHNDRANLQLSRYPTENFLL